MKLPWSFWVDLLVDAAAALFSTLSWFAFVIVLAMAIGECAATGTPEFQGNSTHENPPPRVYACECDEVE